MREEWQQYRVGQVVEYGREQRQIVAIDGFVVTFENKDGTQVQVSFAGYGRHAA